MLAVGGCYSMLAVDCEYWWELWVWWVSVGVCGCLQVISDVCWCLQLFVGVCGCFGVFAGVCGCFGYLRVFAGVCRCLRVSAGVCECLRLLLVVNEDQIGITELKPILFKAYSIS